MTATLAFAEAAGNALAVAQVASKVDKAFELRWGISVVSSPVICA